MDDGSRDHTWEIISDLSEKDDVYMGIRQSRNRGHQNAVYADLMMAKEEADIAISIDCDGQDDIAAMEEMVKAYHEGCEIVYGVRSSHKKDSFFKRHTAQGFYKMMNKMGAEVVYNHADYRLTSSRVLKEFANFREVNLFLRKMLSLAFDGITSLSVKPIRLITSLGLIFSTISFIGVIWALIIQLTGNFVAGRASTVCIICFVGGIQMIGIGVIGEYIGKIYMEVKDRPKYIISDETKKRQKTRNKHACTLGM